MFENIRTLVNNNEDQEAAELINLLDEVEPAGSSLDSLSAVQLQSLKDFLADRWTRIQGTNQCYTQDTKSVSNLACVELAKILAGLEGVSEHKFKLLMPTLVHDECVVTGVDLHDPELNPDDFVLGDNFQYLIHVQDSFGFAAASDSAALLHNSRVDDEGAPAALSATEKHRVVEHYKEGSSYYQVMKAVSELIDNGQSFWCCIKNVESRLA